MGKVPTTFCPLESETLHRAKKIHIFLTAIPNNLEEQKNSLEPILSSTIKPRASRMSPNVSRFTVTEPYGTMQSDRKQSVES